MIRTAEESAFEVILGSLRARHRAEAAETEDSTRSERIRPHRRDQRRHRPVHQPRPQARRAARRRRHRHQAIFCLLTERLRARRRRLHRRRPVRRAWLRRRLWDRDLGERRPRRRRSFTEGRDRAITTRAAI